jgi:hypothetical protein
MNISHKITPLLLTSLLLGGCDTFRNIFGTDHYEPDAFAVTDHPPLIMPPDYIVRPPRPGAERPNAVSATVKAQKTVLGSQVSGSSEPATQGEKDILGKASEKQPVTPKIREIVDEESQTDSTVSGTVLNKIQSWKKEASDNLTLSNRKKAPKEEESSPE